ncbi:MAG: hypothetical protein HZB57_07200 [Gammaproteobacteria bacterium]|nr:hypothetical protein [Gammaproteobacteria bacterium]
MRNSRKHLFLAIIFAVITGCSQYGDYLYAERGCINCKIPEPMHEGKALVYVIRTPYFLNEFELHRIYLLQGDEKKLIGKNQDRTYCPGYLDAGRAEVIIKWEDDNDIAAKLDIEVEAGKIYYIEHDVSGRIYSALIYPKLRLVSEAEGKALLRSVIRKCEN